MSAQLSFDDLARGATRPSCRWLVRTESTGSVNREEMLVILGRCSLLGDTAYDRRCDVCDSWEGRR